MSCYVYAKLLKKNCSLTLHTKFRHFPVKPQNCVCLFSNQKNTIMAYNVFTTPTVLDATLQ